MQKMNRSTIARGRPGSSAVVVRAASQPQTQQQRQQAAHRPRRASNATITTTTTAADAAAAADAVLSSASRRGLLAASAAGAASLALGGTAGVPPARAAAAAAAATAAVDAAAGPPLVPQVALTPRLSVSRVIKGCWQLSGGHRGDKDTDRTTGDAAVADFQPFVDAGVTTFDCADHYGPAEALIGRYLAGLSPEEASRCSVLTKYCVFSGQEMATISKEAVARAVGVSRQRLGRAPEMVQLYWGSYGIPRYVDAGLYLMDLKAAGAIGEIGATNFDTPRLAALVDAGVEVAAHQVQYSLLDRRPSLEMAPYCASKGIGLLPYGVVAGGFLSDKYLGVEARDARADTYSKSKYSSVLVESAGGWGGLQRLLRGLKPVAEKHATSIANVAARWVLQQPSVPAVILGARNASHVGDHQRLFGFELDAADLGEVEALLADVSRAPRGDCYAWERGLGEF